MQRNSRTTSGTGGSTALTDGGREDWLLYGEPADAIGQPNKVFARFDDEFVLFPLELLGEEMVEEHEHVPGEILASTMSVEDYREIVKEMEPLDVNDLVDEIAGEIVWNVQEAEVAIRFGWFHMNTQEIAQDLDLHEETVDERLQTARERYGEAEQTLTYMIPRVTSRAD